jgi:hypothetical protein
VACDIQKAAFNKIGDHSMMEWDWSGLREWTMVEWTDGMDHRLDCGMDYGRTDGMVESTMDWTDGMD